MNTPIVKLENINFFYNPGKTSEAQALKNISLEIMPGDYIAFFGPSGCGKTTLTYLIGGIEELQGPENGRILINGQDLSKLSKKELAVYRQIGVGIIFQQFNLLPSLSVLDNVALPMAFLGVGVDRRRKEAMQLLERFGMTEFANRYSSELSGGQQQRVSIARALANNPPIIIADEPLGNLDSENANKALEFLKELNTKDKRTIIMVTHEAWSLRDATVVVYLKDGEIARVEKRTKQEDETLGEKSLSKHLYKQLFPDATPEKIMSHSLSYMLLRGFSSPEIKRFELFLSKRILGEIDSAKFTEFLDAPFRDGGLGLWKQRAARISLIVDDLLENRKNIEEIYLQLEKDPEMPLYEEITKITDWLLKDYHGSLSGIARMRFSEAVQNRIRNIITFENFCHILELPRSELGAGLSFGTVRSIAERLEAILSGKHFEVLP